MKNFLAAIGGLVVFIACAYLVANHYGVLDKNEEPKVEVVDEVKDTTETVDYEVDVEKMLKSYSMTVGDKTSSGMYYSLKKTSNGNYIIYVIGEENPIEIDADDVVKEQSDKYFVEKITETWYTIYSDNSQSVRTKVQTKLHVPEKTIIEGK